MVTAMGSTEQYCLRWNDFQSNIAGAFAELRDDEELLDVTLVSDGRSLRAHRLVLSACSPLFREMLRQGGGLGGAGGAAQPLVFLHGVRFRDAVAILNFMYRGEVNVNQEDLQAFLAAAEDLRIRGLSDRGGGGKGGGGEEEGKSSRHSTPPAAATSKRLVPTQKKRPRAGSASPPPAPTMSGSRRSPSSLLCEEGGRVERPKRRMVVSPEVEMSRHHHHHHHQVDYENSSSGGGDISYLGETFDGALFDPAYQQEPQQQRGRGGGRGGGGAAGGGVGGGGGGGGGGSLLKSEGSNGLTGRKRKFVFSPIIAPNLGEQSGYSNSSHI